MPAQQTTLRLASPEDTAERAVALGMHLAPGDPILLSGPVGAGKTHFARHLIQSLLLEHEDVPSPTFTVVQIYDTQAGPLWHCDLYRIGSTLEIEELGLLDAFEEAICLVEWPDRLGDLAPEDGLHLDLAQDEDDAARLLKVHWTAARWAPLVTAWAAA